MPIDAKNKAEDCQLLDMQVNDDMTEEALATKPGQQTFF
jgi:hypothetical protein